MEYWITNNDMNILKVIQNGNNLKMTGRYRDGRVIILPPTTADEHIAIQGESKARTTLLQSIPDDHVADFHYMDDARDIWNTVKARFGGNAESKKMRKSMLKQEFSEFKIGEAEGLHKGYDRMQKILSQLNQLKAKPEDEDINLKFLRALHSSWSQVALTLKTKGGLEVLSFDDLYYKLKTLEVDVKGNTTFSSSQSAGPNHSAFVSTIGASKKMSYGDSPSYSSTTTYTAPSNSKTGSHRSGNVIEDVLQSFIADTEPEQLAYEDFEQIEKLDLEEMDLKWQMAMLSVRVHKFEQKAGRKIDFDKKESARFNKKKVRCCKCQQRGHSARECRANGGNDKQRYSSFKIKEIGKKEKDSKALITVDTLVDWTNHDGESDGVISFKEFGMTAGCDTDDAIEESAAKIYNLITGADTEEASTAGDAGEFALMGVTSKTIGIRVVPVHSRNKVNHHNQFIPQAVLLKTIKVNIPHARSQPVPTGKPKVFAPVPIGRQNRPFLVPSDRGYSPSKNPFPNTEDEEVFDSGYSRSMTGNKERLDDFQVFQGEKVTFGGGEGRITGKGTIQTLTLDFENVYYVKELQQFNLFSISQIYDKKNRVLFIDTECLVLSKDFKLPEVWWGNLACLVAHALVNESVKWHRRMGHVNYKNMNRLVKGNLVRGLPLKLFKNDHTCVACCKGKQHKASYKAINAVSSIFEPLQFLYMDLFGHTSIRSIDHKYYCLVITDDYSRFRWVFFLEHKDETYPILKDFINLVANQLNKKAIRIDKVNQSAGAQEATTNPTGTQDADSDSDYDEQVIIVPSYPSHNIQGTEPKDTSGDEVDDSPLNSAEEIFKKELARLKGQEQRATSDAESLGLGFANDAEELQKRASAKPVPPGSIPVPTGSVPVPSGDTIVSTDDVLVHTIVQTRSKVKKTTTGESAFISYIYDQQRDNHTDFQHCLFACFLPQVEPRSVAQALEDPSSVDAMQEEMQHFKFQNVWVLVDLPEAQGHRQEKDINYDEVFASVARIEAIRLFLAFASYMGFMVYQMDVKSAFLYRRINEEVYVTQPKGFVDPQHPKKVYTVVKALYGLHQAPRAWLQVQQRPDGIFINQDKYVQEILNKFDLGSVRMATTPYEAPKPKSKDEYDSPVNVHLYISMIGSLMYLTASRLDIMFAVSACPRNQVTPTTSNLEAVKKIFKYVKGQPKLGLWYPRESPLVLEAYSDSDYAGVNKDRKSTTGGCQFLGRRSPELGPPAIQATIDKTPYTITEDLVRSQLQLADDGGIDDLPIAEIYFGIDNLGPLAVALICLSDGRRFNWLNFEGHSMPLLAAMLSQDQEGEGVGVAAQAVPHHMPVSDQSQAHLPTPLRQHTSNLNASVFNHGQNIPTASYDDPPASAFPTVSAIKGSKEFPLPVKDDPTARAFCHYPTLGNNKWYQSLLRSFGQKKNNTQVQQSLLLWPSQVQVLKMRELIRTRKVLDTVLFPPPAQVYSPLKKDMSWTGLPEFADDTITDYSRPSPSVESNTSDLQNSNSSIFEHGESSSSILFKPMIKFVKAAECPEVIKTNKVKTARKSPVKYAEMYRNTSKSPKVRGNQRNWNNLKSKQLGKDFLMKNKACFKCGHFDHLAYDYGVWVEKGKNWPKNNSAHKNVTSKADLHKTGRTIIRVNRPNMNVAQPKRTYFAKTTHSYVRRPFHRRLTVRTQSQVLRVSTVTKRFPIIDLKFSTIKSTFSANWGNIGKAVKASACWIWRPKQNTTEKCPNCNSVLVIFKKYQYIDTQGRLKSVMAWVPKKV
uniref:Putative ribonuclease H-like domain-containing protein n=1 Tax=Tanacetum cinerariifolium TaxID=118510 RepID=A0A6L2NKQ2_TANCI|nr:putative ribonuclease H-like domain-containing protein [Tanacetum cinerariifolium]